MNAGRSVCWMSGRERQGCERQCSRFRLSWHVAKDDTSNPQKGASRLCAPGFKLCRRADTLNQFVCSTLAGFYVADVPTRAALPSASCGVVRGGESAGFAGPARVGRGVWGAVVRGVHAGLFVTAGSGLAVVTPVCRADGTTQNTSGSNGVLCCK